MFDGSDGVSLIGELPSYGKKHLPHYIFGTHAPTKHVFPLHVTGWNLATAVSNSSQC